MEIGVRNIKRCTTEEIHIRNTFVYADQDKKKYYLFGTTFADGCGAVTLNNTECLDGTFYVDDNNQPWIIFSHEWTVLSNGKIKALKLNDDLKSATVKKEQLSLLLKKKMIA